MEKPAWCEQMAREERGNLRAVVSLPSCFCCDDRLSCRDTITAQNLLSGLKLLARVLKGVGETIHDQGERGEGNLRRHVK
jgi:hypothetical protein